MKTYLFYPILAKALSFSYVLKDGVGVSVQFSVEHLPNIGGGERRRVRERENMCVLA